MKIFNKNLIFILWVNAFLLTGIVSKAWATCTGATTTAAGTDENGAYCGSWDCGAEGSSVTCTLSKGTLTISGNGDMKDYTLVFNRNENAYPRFHASDAPWSGKMMTKAVVEGNVTKIGAATFAGETYLTEISGMESVKVITDGAFSRTGLTSIDISNVEELVGAPFHKARDLQYIIMKADVKVKDDWFSFGAGVFPEVPALNGNRNNCAINNGYMVCGTCDGYIKDGTGCVADCGTGYLEKEGHCVVCSANTFSVGGICLPKRYTPTDLADIVGESNTILLYYK